MLKSILRLYKILNMKNKTKTFHTKSKIPFEVNLFILFSFFPSSIPPLFFGKLKEKETYSIFIFYDFHPNLMAFRFRFKSNPSNRVIYFRNSKKEKKNAIFQATKTSSFSHKYSKSYFSNRFIYLIIDFSGMESKNYVWGSCVCAHVKDHSTNRQCYLFHVNSHCRKSFFIDSTFNHSSTFIFHDHFSVSHSITLMLLEAGFIKYGNCIVGTFSIHVDVLYENVSIHL